MNSSGGRGALSSAPFSFPTGSGVWQLGRCAFEKHIVENLLELISQMKEVCALLY